MNNIYSFLKSAWEEILDESKKNSTFIPFLLLLITFPISMAVNNISTAIFVLSAFLSLNKSKLKIGFVFIVPMSLFIWMLLSYFWSYEPDDTLKAIFKEITLILIPLAFVIKKPFSSEQKNLIFKYYSFAMVGYVIYFLIRAGVRYILTKDVSVFFYHGPENDVDTGLVPRLLNAIHVSVYVVLSFFYFFCKESKTTIEKILLGLLFVFVLLLSSKNIIIVFIVLIFLHTFYSSKIANKLRLRNATIVLVLLGVILSFSKIKERFLIEFTSNTNSSLTNNSNTSSSVNNISIYQAWNQEKFTHNDYFPGTAFRVYQVRVFKELIMEYPIFWKGFGMNASQEKIQEKEKEHNLYPGYGSYNFHNQYVQNFADLGIVGLFFLILMLFLNIKKAFSNKDFIHITFAILMISLFLTESFLWRQRGVCFFIMFYCFFMNNNEQKKQLVKDFHF